MRVELEKSREKVRDKVWGKVMSQVMAQASGDALRHVDEHVWDRMRIDGWTRGREVFFQAQEDTKL